LQLTESCRPGDRIVLDLYRKALLDQTLKLDSPERIEMQILRKTKRARAGFGE